MVAKKKGAETKENDVANTKKTDAIDEIFSEAKEKKNKKKRSGDENVNDGDKKKKLERILLPGQKKLKGKRLNAKGEEVPEFVPVEKPRRLKDGLPVYKSYGDFTDMKHGQQKMGKNGRVLGPNGEEGGKCPFDCWCCF